MNKPASMSFRVRNTFLKHLGKRHFHQDHHHHHYCQRQPAITALIIHCRLLHCITKPPHTGIFLSIIRTYVPCTSSIQCRIYIFSTLGGWQPTAIDCRRVLLPGSNYFQYITRPGYSFHSFYHLIQFWSNFSFVFLFLVFLLFVICLNLLYLC